MDYFFAKLKERRYRQNNTNNSHSQSNNKESLIVNTRNTNKRNQYVLLNKSTNK